MKSMLRSRSMVMRLTCDIPGRRSDFILRPPNDFLAPPPGKSSPKSVEVAAQHAGGDQAKYQDCDRRHQHEERAEHQRDKRGDHHADDEHREPDREPAQPRDMNAARTVLLERHPYERAAARRTAAGAIRRNDLRFGKIVRALRRSGGHALNP